MPTTAQEIRAAVEERFAQVACSPDQERKFPVGPASAKKLGYDPARQRLPGTLRANPPSRTTSSHIFPRAGCAVSKTRGISATYPRANASKSISPCPPKISGYGSVISCMPQTLVNKQHAVSRAFALG